MENSKEVPKTVLCGWKLAFQVDLLDWGSESGSKDFQGGCEGNECSKVFSFMFFTLAASRRYGPDLGLVFSPRKMSKKYVPYRCSQMVGF